MMPTPTKLPLIICSKRRSWSGQMICEYSSSKRPASSSSAPSPYSRNSTVSGRSGPLELASIRSRNDALNCGLPMASRSMRARVSRLRLTASIKTCAFAGSARPGKFSFSVDVVARTRTACSPPFTNGSHPPAEMCSLAAVFSALASMPLEMPSSDSFQSPANASLNSGNGLVGSARSAYCLRRVHSSRGAYCASIVMRLLTSSSLASKLRMAAPSCESSYSVFRR